MYKYQFISTYFCMITPSTVSSESTSDHLFYIIWSHSDTIAHHLEWVGSNKEPLIIYLQGTYIFYIFLKFYFIFIQIQITFFK